MIAPGIYAAEIKPLRLLKAKLSHDIEQITIIVQGRGLNSPSDPAFMCRSVAAIGEKYNALLKKHASARQKR
jgi:hypothetical protein